jgi:hypothetical protein
MQMTVDFGRVSVQCLCFRVPRDRAVTGRHPDWLPDRIASRDGIAQLRPECRWPPPPVFCPDVVAAMTGVQGS